MRINKNEKGVALVAKKQGNVIGFLLARMCLRGELPNIIRKKNLEHLSADVVHSGEDGTLGLLKTVAVDSSSQGRGVGHQLMSEAESRLSTMGVKIIIVPAWKDGDKINIMGLMTYHNYKEFLTDNEYWKLDCERKKFHCPSKADGHCKCGVKFFRKTV